MQCIVILACVWFDTIAWLLITFLVFSSSLHLLLLHRNTKTHFLVLLSYWWYSFLNLSVDSFKQSSCWWSLWQIITLIYPRPRWFYFRLIFHLWYTHTYEYRVQHGTYPYASIKQFLPEFFPLLRQNSQIQSDCIWLCEFVISLHLIWHNMCICVQCTVLW